MSKGNKTIYERYADDILTDNSSLNKYSQCKKCIFRDKTTVSGEECGWEKGCCRMYPYPKFKPNDVMLNKVECEYYEKEKRKK